MGFYTKHVFICVNQRNNEEKCCNQSQAIAAADYLKAKLKTLDLSGPGKIRVSRSGCLGRCSLGPCIVIYPDNLWFTYSSLADIDEIITKYLQNGEVVERLLLDSL